MAGQKVLVIEDEGDILEIIAYNLGREGYQVLSSRDGEEGLEIAQREEPDLILLDLMLPGTDGLEICRIIKDGPRGADTPIIMVTAKGEESDVVLGLGMGADDYVVKPFSPRELVARVKAVLRRGPLRVKPESGERVERDGVVIDAVAYDGPILQEVMATDSLGRYELVALTYHPQFYAFGLRQGLPRDLRERINTTMLGLLEQLEWRVLLAEHGLE